MPRVHNICPLSAEFLQLDGPTQQRMIRSLRVYWGPGLDPALALLRRRIARHDAVCLWSLQLRPSGPCFRRSLAQGAGAAALRRALRSAERRPPRDTGASG